MNRDRLGEEPILPRCPTCYRRLAEGAACPEDGSTAPMLAAGAAVPKEPLDLPGFTIGAPLGSGGFGVVWAAKRDTDGAQLALKVAHSPQLGARFTREADALAKVGSPHVPELHHRGVLMDGRQYLVMERLDGETLAEQLAGLSSPPPASWVRQIGLAVLASLEAVHAHGLVHRDLKPENIFLCSDGHAALMDFGVVKTVAPSNDATATRSGTVLGTAEYMAPEQLVAMEEIDARADLYAFGVLLFELLTLRVPFCGDRPSIEHGHTTLRPPSPREHAPVPEPVEKLCLACLAKDPSRRPESAAAVREALDRSLPDRSATAHDDAVHTPRGTTLLTEASQPVVLLVADMPTLERDVSDSVTRRRGVVARQHACRYVCAFSGLIQDDPAGAALAAAKELTVQHGARAVLHLAALKVRRGKGSAPVRVYGVAVERPESWLPDESWEGLLLTPVLAQILTLEETSPDPEHDGFLTLGAATGGRLTTMVGRDRLLERARLSLRTCLDTRTPGLFTVLGDSGLGKSLVAEAIARMAQQDRSHATVVAKRVERRERGDEEGTLRGLVIDLATAVAGSTAASAASFSRVSPGADRMLVLGEGLRQAAATGPLVVVIDDLHDADDATLDAIEYATLDGTELPLWVVVISDPGLRRRRPQWGMGAQRHDEDRLLPLEKAAAMRLAGELLRPAEYPPAATLRRLAEWSGGVPRSLVEIAAALKRDAVVRRRPGTDGWYVATAEIDRLPASPVRQWLALRRIEGMPPARASFLRVCAVLGVELERAEIEWVQSAAARAGTASTPVDAGVGLAELERDLVLARSGSESWVFIDPELQRAVYELLDPADREQIHRNALELWRSRRDGREGKHAWSAIARHASAIGEDTAAFDAYVALGDHASAGHRYVDADRHYTAALELATTDLPRRAAALGRRGTMRYRMQRIPESLEDLRAAREHAETLRDAPFLVDMLLEEATALDWAHDFALSAKRAEEAGHHARGWHDERIVARCEMALGRTRFRQERIPEAVELLTRAASRAARIKDNETRIISLLLLGPVLVFAEQLDAAARRFDEVIALCEAIGDRLHLCAALTNRSFLCEATKDAPQLLADLHRAVQLAREVGQATLERGANHNLAEFLHWSGEHDQALAFACRAATLQERIIPDPVAADNLLLARVHAALGSVEEARRRVERVASTGAQRAALSPSEQLVVRMLELVFHSAAGTATSVQWDVLLRDSRDELPGEEFLEALYFRARCAAVAGRRAELHDTLAEAEPRLAELPIWRPAFERLRSRWLEQA